MDPLSPAAQQLCCFLSFDPKAQPGLAFASTVDWPSMLSLARPQNLAPLLYQRIHLLGLCNAVPPETHTALRTQYLLSRADSLWLVHQLDAILAGLNTARIPVIPLKGIYLA